VLAGYVIGCASGFVVAILADRVAFLRRGLLPIGNFVSALPMIGVAPIMVMWFGFDWQSKAAVVVIMTFFPMLVNTVAGLAASGTMERDLMQHLRLQLLADAAQASAAGGMPFIFNALKINSTLALIGAIVAEFFGTPIVGMGFPHLHRDRAHECRHGLGRNRRCGAGWLDLLRRRRPHRTGGDVLASVYPWWLGVAYSREWDWA
jgi:NitT/TauT family transport system permease protein